MKNRSFSAGVLAAALIAGLPATAVWSADKAEVQKAIAAAEDARKMAASVGGEWRDTGKFIKKAQKLAEEGKLDEALKLATKAQRQGELGYDQALGQKDATMPEYMKAGGDAKHTAAASGENKITLKLDSVEVMHNGEKVVVKRDHDKEATLPAEFMKTDRGCPPFCVQPMVAAEGVTTVGELEVLDFLKSAAEGDASILVVDSRTPDWAMRGTIPGSVNIPWNQLRQDSMAGMFGDAGESQTDKILEEHFGAKKGKKGWDFADAKTLVLFCNGIWCGQSSSNIATLIGVGYPADKLKWYRGGMQDWVSAGLTTVKP
jgi:rhodanese-related sulfurtransferase